MNRWHLSNSIAINYLKGRLHCIWNGLVQAIGHAIRLADAACRKSKELSPRHHNDFRNANDPLSATSSTFKGDIVCKITLFYDSWRVTGTCRAASVFQ